MRFQAARALTALVVIASALTTGASARADPKDPPSADEASERFRSGVAFYKDGDFTAAQVEFRRAHELSPNYRVLYNLGQTSRELKDYAGALSAFEQYLREGGKEVPAARRKDVQAWVDQLKNKVGTISVTTNVEGAEILLDDVRLGVSPLAAPVVVNVGRHKFSATHGGFRAAQRALDVAGMQAASVALELAPIEEAAAAPTRADAPTSTEPAAPAERRRGLAPWVTLSITAAAGVATGVLGGLALSARGDLRDALATYPGSPPDLKAAQDRTRTLALATDVLGGVTIAGAIATAVLFAVGPGGAPPKPRAASVGVSPGGVVLVGRF